MSYQTITKNRARSTADATWAHVISDNMLEARCCQGYCSARIVKTTKNLLPTMPSFEPPTIAFIMENTRSINKALKFINSTLMCLNKSIQRNDLFATINLSSNQLLETISNFECFFLSLLTERISFVANNDSIINATPNDSSLSSGGCFHVGSSSSGLGSGDKLHKNGIYHSVLAPSEHFQKYNEFNFTLMVFLFAIDRLQYTEMDSMFEEFSGVGVEQLSVIDIADIFIDHWHSIVNMFTSFSSLSMYREEKRNFNDDVSSNRDSQSSSKHSIEPTSHGYHSLRKVTSMSDGMVFVLANQFEILKERTLKEMTAYKDLSRKLVDKANQMDTNEFISVMRHHYSCYDQNNLDDYPFKMDTSSNIPLIFSFHNMMNIQCVCHGPSDYHKYTLNFHLEAGRPIDIIRYMAKIRLQYYNDSNCATQIDLFLVTYRLFISLQDLVDVLLGEVYRYFPELHREPHHLFYSNTILLIDVISNVFESGQALGHYLPQLWQLMYCLVLRGRHNLALALRRSLQHYLTVANSTLPNLNHKVSQNVEQHQQLFEPKVAVKKLLSLSPSDVAAQLTTTDEEIFHAINLGEILYWFHLKYQKCLSSDSVYSSSVGIYSSNSNQPQTCSSNNGSCSTPKIPAYIEPFSYRKICANMNRSTARFHFVNHWTVKIINCSEKKSKRIKRLEFMFKLLDSLFNLGNIHSAFAVYTGMSSSNNTKLITSLLESNQEFYDIWYKLSHMTDITNSHESYRSIIDSLQAPFIPYLGIAMSDINMLKLSMKDNLKESNLFDTNIKSHSLIALTPKNVTKLSDEVLFKGIKLPSPLFDETYLDQMINMRKLWRYFNVLRCNITKPRLVHYNISIDKYIQSVILSCDQL